MTGITFDEFEKIKDNGSVVVAFGSPTCKDCEIARPMLMELSKKYADINFYGIMVSSGDDTMLKMNLRHIPTILFLKDGKEVHSRIVEPKDMAVLEEAIKTLL